MRFGDGKMEWHFEMGTDPLIDGSSLTFGDFANLAVDVPFEGRRNPETPTGRQDPVLQLCRRYLPATGRASSVMTRPISVETARRLAVSAALLDARRPPPNGDGILSVVRGLTGLQLDPTRAVEYSHLLVLWSRLGPFARSDLDRLLWQERRLFEYRAFIVPVESYPWHREAMRRFAAGPGAWRARARAWLAANEPLRRRILERLAADGPLAARAFTPGPGVVPWRSSGWTDMRNAAQMLEFLAARGEILVAGRAGRERLWDLAERVLPAWTPREELDPTTLTARWVERVVRRLGIAERGEIAARVPVAGSREVRAALGGLVDEGRLIEVRVGSAEAYVSAHDLPLLSQIESGAWVGRTVLLSPFDPLIRTASAPSVSSVSATAWRSTSRGSNAATGTS